MQTLSPCHSDPPKTYREIVDEACAHFPTHCPACGSDSDFAPTFVGDCWSCGVCDYVWEVTRDQE